MDNNKIKELITNADFGPDTPTPVTLIPICYASNNSDENRREYKISHNSRWLVVWKDTIPDNLSSDFVVDCCCVAVRNSGKTDPYNDLVFRNNMGSSNGGILIFGDKAKKRYPRLKEVFIQFDKVDPDIKRIDFLLNIYHAKQLKQNFSVLTQMRIRIESDITGGMAYQPDCEDVYQYNIASIPYESNILKLGEYVREPDGWIYKPVVEGFDIEFRELIYKYGFKFVALGKTDMQHKELITNSDHGPHCPPPGLRSAICYASNNSGENRKEYKTLHNCLWTVAWEDTNPVNLSPDFDVDCCCVAVRNSGKHDFYNDFVFWNNMKSSNGGISIVGGWNVTSMELMVINFDKIDPDVKRIDFLLNIYDAKQLKRNFSVLTKMRIRIESDIKDRTAYPPDYEDVYQYDIASIPYESNILKLGEFVRDSDGWIYKPVVEGFDIEFRELIDNYFFPFE